MKAVRRFCCLIGLAIPVLAITGSDPALAQNLINNPGFESGLTGWEDWGDAGTVRGPRGKAGKRPHANKRSHANKRAYAGKRSLRIGRRSGGVGQDVLSRIEPGATYRLTGYAKRDSGLSGHTFGIRFETSSGSPILERDIVADSTRWARYRIDFEAPSGASAAWVFVWKEDRTGYGYVDDLKLVRTDTASEAPRPDPDPKPDPDPDPDPDPEPTSPPPGASDEPPPAGGYPDIALLAPTATLPTAERCLDRVRRSSWEPRPQNDDENYNTTPLLIEGIAAIDAEAQEFYLDRIAAANAANVTGTTDELIQFFSCYWGVDDESTRARAVIESWWDQDVNGDRGSCAADPGGVSWGLLQIKDRRPRGCTPAVHDGTYPDVFVSTGANLNYALAWLVGCYRGDMSHWISNEFMGDPPRRMRECIGLWFSGRWRQDNARYLTDYDEAMATTPWLRSDFANQAAAGVCRERACDTLPAD